MDAVGAPQLASPVQFEMDNNSLTERTREASMVPPTVKRKKPEKQQLTPLFEFADQQLTIFEPFTMAQVHSPNCRP